MDGAAPRPAGRPGRSTYLAYRSLASTVQRLPRPVAAGLATASGLAMWQVGRGRREIVRANLRRVLGPRASERDLDRAVLESFDSYARYWMESARLSAMSASQVARRFSIEGFDAAEEVLATGKGAIFALPHLGSWEVGGYWLTLQGHPMTAVVEPLEPPELFEWFRRQRTALGLTVVPSGPEATATLVRTLRSGGLVGLVADRDLSGNGVEVSFFGETTTLPAGPAVLALRTGAPLFPVAVYQRPGGYYHGVVRPQVSCERTGRLRDDVRGVISVLAREFEHLIRAAPTQWHMFQPNWPSDRGNDLDRARGGAGTSPHG